MQSILIAIAKAKAHQWSSKVVAYYEGDLHAPQLEHNVKVSRDKQGMPHVYARTQHDAFFTQGYLQASERLWQLELIRRIGRGTLSEAFGEASIPIDTFARTMGWRKLAESTWEHVNEHAHQTRDTVQAFRDGINHFLTTEKGKYAVEFKLLGFEPEAWSCIDVIQFERFIGFQLSAGFQQKLIRARLMMAIGTERSNVVSYYEPDCPAAVPDSVNFKDVDMSLVDAFDDITSIFESLDQSESKTGAGISRGQGSNAWAIHGSRTESGKPILASDPHLKLALPNVWYPIHLNVTPYDGKSGMNNNHIPLNVIGAGIPGFPGVFNGHNDYIAWGITLSYIDVEDLYLEKFDTTSNKYLSNNTEWKDPEIYEEIIHIKGIKEPKVLKVMKTEHGPIISKILEEYVDNAVDGVYENKEPEKINILISLASKTFLPVSNCSSAQLLLNRAKNWTEFCAAALMMNTPVFNFVYADIHGDIGYYMPGECPKRKPGHTGLIPVPGWTGEYDWDGIIPKNEMPHSHNPEQGFIASCNHKAIPDNYEHYLGNIWWWGYRAKMANIKLKEDKKWTLQDSVDLQLNVESLHGRELMRIIKEYKYEPKNEHINIYNQLLQWDYQLDINSIGGAIYEALIYELIFYIFETGIKNGIEQKHGVGNYDIEKRVPALIQCMLGTTFLKGIKGKNEIGSFTHGMLLRMLEEPDSEQKDNIPNFWMHQVGGLQNCLNHCFDKVIVLLNNKLGNDISQWKWGDLHSLHLIHPMSAKLGKNSPFDRRDYKLPGDVLTLNMSSTAMDGTFQAGIQAGVSVRMVTDMSNLDNSLWIMPGGQSSHIASAHYNDMTQRFVDGKMENLYYDEKTVLENEKYVLNIFPKESDCVVPLKRGPVTESKTRKVWPIVIAAVSVVGIAVYFIKSRKK